MKNVTRLQAKTVSTISALALAAVAAVPTIGWAADLTMTATDAVNTSSFFSGLHFDGNPIAQGNNYIVPAGFALRTPFDQATDITFLGDSLKLNGTTAFPASLTIKNATNVNTTINNLTLDGALIQNAANAAGTATAETVTSNAITVGANGATFNAVGAGRTLTVNGPIALSGALTLLSNGGTVNTASNVTGTGNVTLNAGNNYLTFTGTNTYTGNTTISGSTYNGAVFGAVRASEGTNIPLTSNLALASGVMDTSTNVTRNLGTGAGEITITGAAAGFTAIGTPVTIAIGGTAAPTPLVWGSANFNPTAFILNDFNGNNTLTFANDIDLGGTATTIRYIMSSASNAATQSVIAGTISGTGNLRFYGSSTTVITKASTYTGTTTIGEFLTGPVSSPSAVVRVAATNALSTGEVTIGLAGNGVLGRLELTNNSTLPNAIVMPSRNTTAVAIENISGNNELSGTIGITSGGSINTIQSDAGLLTISGASPAAGGIALQSLLGARIVTLTGAGNGSITGIVRDSSTGASGVTIGLTKAGAGTWTLAGINSYTGATTISAGTLQIGDGTAGHDGTIATTSGITDNATLAYNRFGTATSDRVISGTGAVTKLGVGTQILTGANTYTGLTTVAGGTLQVTTAASTPLLTGVGTDIQAGQVIFDYTGGGPTAATIRGLLQTSYASAFATGVIKDTLATANKGLGYKDTGTSVVVKATLYGDADLDGSVTIIDFNALATNFGANTGKVWVDGDFTYDGAVGITDFNALAVNFGQSLPPGADHAEEMAPLLAFAITHDDLPQFYALTGVPEPTSLGLLAAGAIVGLRRRRNAR